MMKAMVLAGVLCFGGLAGAADPAVARWDFEAKPNLSPFPAAVGARMSIDRTDFVAGKGALVLKNSGGASATMYQYYDLKGADTPGFLTVKCQYRLTGGGKAELQLQFNAPGGGNGSNGKAMLPLAAAEQWRTFNAKIPVPSGTAVIQFAFSVRGGEEFKLDDLSFAYNADATAVTLPKPACAARFDFDKNVQLTAWPGKLKSALSVETADTNVGAGALAITNRTGEISAYSGMKLTPAGPGAIAVSCAYKFASETPATLSWQLNFNLPGKGNGSGGSATATLPYAKNWTRFRQVFTVPPEVAAVQYVLNLKGPETKVLIDDLEIAFTPDTMAIPLKAGNFTAGADAAAWNPRLVSYGFYNAAMPALEPIALQLAADRTGLYVLFRNDVDPAKVRTTITENDAALWNDDVNDVFIFDEVRQLGWQFMLNAAGVRFDAKLVQRVPGDPWKADASWSGEWRGMGKKTDYGFETRFFIPWTTLGVDPAKGADLAINFAAELKNSAENSTWNAYRGKFTDVGQYAKLTLSEKLMTVTRNRNVEKISYAIHRPAPAYAAVLQKGVPGHYRVDVWSSGINRSDFPAAVMAKVSDAEFSAWQDELLRAWGEAGIGGNAWPWTLSLGRERVLRVHEKHAMKFPFAIDNSSLGRKARQNAAQFFNPANDHACDATDPAFVAVIDDFIRSRREFPDYELMKKTVKFGMGVDEPTNNAEVSYNPAVNKANTAALAEVSEKIRAEYGFGKYGSPFTPGIDEAAVPFARIAFYRWWNTELRKVFTRYQESFKTVFPGVPFHMTTDNNCSGQSNLDAANLNGAAELIACDPYPTSCSAFYGKARALYHTGFSTRVLHDLVPSARTMTMPQCFIYHGGHGDAAAMREWASQALKNGASWLMWYCAGAPWEIFDDYAAMLEISAAVAKMDKIALPEKTRTLVWYSNFDKWAKADYAQHALYSVFAMLGEVLGSNFRIVSDTTLTRGDLKLADYQLLYVPVMSYTTPEIADRIAAWVKAGGVLVVFDPLFMSFNIDGSENPNRTVLTGQESTALPVRTAAGAELRYQGKTLPVAMIANAATLKGSRYAAYTITPGDAAVVATYADGTPAAAERTVGRGKVIYFAVQPFAGSELVTRPEAWRDFFAALAARVGEPTGLPIWNFLLPEPPSKIKLQKLIR